MDLPLVEEVAADIFMGTFTDNWRLAALTASRSLAGTLYARYYDLPDAQAWTGPLTQSRAAAAGPGRPASTVTERWEKRVAEGEARLLLRVLKARGLQVPEENRKQVLTCTDTAQLEEWGDRAPPRPRSPTYSTAEAAGCWLSRKRHTS